MPAAASVVSSNGPSVFLPTLDQVEAEASLADTDAEPTRFNFGDPATIESTTQTVTFEQPQSAAAPAQPPASAPLPAPVAPPSRSSATLLVIIGFVVVLLIGGLLIYLFLFNL